MGRKATRVGRDLRNINFTVTTAVKAQVDRCAKEQDVTTSHLMRRLVRRYLRAAAERHAAGQGWPEV